MPRYIKLDEQNVVISIRVGEEIIDGEVQSDTGDLGQIKQADGTFVDAPIPVVTNPTLEDKINYLYYKSKGVI